MRLSANEIRRKLESSIIYLGEHGFHGRTIADAVGTSKWFVYHICYKAGVKLRDYRDGKNEVAERVIVQAPVVKLGLAKQIKRGLPKVTKSKHKSKVKQQLALAN